MANEAELEILLGDLPVGRLRYRDDGSSFRLLDSYANLSNRPVLGQIFEDDPGRVEHVRSGIPPWFSNLLPEGPLRELVAQEAGVNSARSFFLLEHLGNDLPGAVRAIRVPVGSLGSSRPAEPQAESTPSATEYVYKFSLAGVQLKFSVLKDERGLTIPVRSQLGDFIVKLPDDRFDHVPENEFAMMTWARSAGVDVPEIELVETGSISNIPSGLTAAAAATSFVVRRFDRDEGRRVHIEDFAQVLNRPPTADGKYRGANYETVARIILATSGMDDLHEFVRRLVAMVLMGNGDAHLKNWSFIYRDGRTARLSSAYDLVSTLTYVRGRETLALKLAGTNSFESVTLKSFRRLARKLDLSSESDLDEVVASAAHAMMHDWPRIRSELAIDPAVRDGIDGHLSQLPLLDSL